MSDKKFLHVALHRHENLFNVRTMIGGFYNWHRAFEGEFNLYKTKEHALENYDILFMGMSKPELEGVVATQIRKKIGHDTKTKLVICIDYAIELWQGTFNPHALENELMQADMIFVSEPTMQSYVKALLNDRKEVHHLVHPSALDDIRRMYKPKELRSDEIIALIHRYDNNWMAPYLVTKDLPWNTWLLCLDPNILVTLYAYFKYLKAGFEFLQYLDWASRKKVMLDSYHKIHTYGRAAVDSACLQVPIVGSNWTYSQNYLWPKLTVEAGDVSKQKELIIKLFEDENFYDDVVEEAAEKVEMYSYENRVKALLDKLEN